MIALLLPCVPGVDLAAGEHSLDGRDFYVTLPNTSAALPVVIFLHGGGGSGETVANIAAANRVLAERHILVGPTGP